MRLLTAVLALAVLVASCRGAEPSRLDEATEAVSRYVEELLNSMLVLSQKSELGQEIQRWQLLKTMESVADDLARTVPPAAQAPLRALARQLEVLLAALWVLERELQPYVSSLRAALASYAESPLELVEQYGKILLDTQTGIIPSRLRLQERLAACAQKLGLQEMERDLAAYAKALHQTLHPAAEALHTWLSTRWVTCMQWLQ
ncbi:uncharacterized protein LOC142824216 [Pelodiscus sinensis]|uniref:uncharacterized protein LOC142824216 n=1 Tax=Pelodiscus sinensis TaxID=13735 RepID=UPI003F6B790B